MGSVWEGLKHMWHDLWAPSPSDGGGGAAPTPPAPTQAPAGPDVAGGHDANYWRTMTQVACPTTVPIIQNPTASDAQAEYMACMAGAPIGINIAPPTPAMPSPYGDSFNP